MYLLFDIGGTKTRLALTRDQRSIEAQVKFDTPKRFDDAVARLGEEGRRLAGGGSITAAAGGIRGRIDRKAGGVAGDVVLSDFVGKPLRDSLAREWGTSTVELENDASLAGLGEAHFGAGKGFHIVAYYTVSTGVGGARIVEGKIDDSSHGFEPGNQVIDLDTTVGGQGADTLEELISGTALEGRRGVKPYDIPQADPVWDELARYLAVGLKNTVTFWSPDAIVLGGSMVVGDPRIPLTSVRLHMNALLTGLMPAPPVFDAAFRDEGGLYGAMALLKEKGL